MRRLGYRIMSIILTAALVLGELSLGTEPIHAEAASSLPIVNEADVTARIKDLAVKLGLDGNLNQSRGVIFTVNRQGCTHASNNAQASGCTNCKNNYVIQSDWFRETFGYTVNVNYLPGHYTPTGSMTSSGWTCVGFANFALWYIAKENSTSDVYRDLLGTQGQAFTKANLVNSGIRIGDVIRVDGYGHSMMFLSYDGDSQIKVLDCNWTGSGTYPVGIVRIHSLALNSAYKMAITRARNYQPDSAGTGITPPPAHACSGTFVQANTATCTTAGNIAYYVCSCGKWYWDSACTIWITNANDVVIPATGHNWTEATCTAPQTCSTCGATTGAALDHDYSGAPEYADHLQHVYQCTRGCGTPKKESHTDIDDDFTCEVCKGNTLDPAKEGLHVELQNPNEQYVYTGSEIKPAIIVTNNGRVLTAGVDYTVKYSNNTRASMSAAEKSKPRVTVTGKGNLTGSNYTTFDIQPKNIGDEDVVAGSLSVASGTKATPVLTYNGRKLTAADFTVEDAQKKYTENGELKVNGKGNYTGSLSIPVKVVEKAALRKFSVTVGPEKLIYNGEAQKVSFTVTDASTKQILTENKDYQVVYPSGMTNAGTVKFSVVGVGDYTGTVTKSYKIDPLVVKTGMQVTGVNPKGYPYNSKGVTIGGDLTVTYNSGAGSSVLTEGKDYKITYSNNKKIGTSAQYTISFIGNYKGSSALKGSFSIYSSGLTDATPGLKISVADQTYTGKAGAYKSEPYITVGGIKLSQSSYAVAYYRDAGMTQEIKGSANKITMQEDEAFTTVYVKITGKGNYAPAAGTTGYATASYKVCNRSVYKDLSKARVTFWDASGKKITKTEYTGKEIKPIVKVEIKEGKNYVEVPSDQYKVTYMSNINKGKAKVIVTGTGNSYGGSKTATFQIVAKNIKTLKDLLKGLFGL